MTATPLDAVQILAFERLQWKYAGAKESEIRHRFDVSSLEYYAALTRVLADPASLEIDAQLVRRLQRIRDRQREQRSSRRLRVEPRAS